MNKVILTILSLTSVTAFAKTVPSSYADLMQQARNQAVSGDDNKGGSCTFDIQEDSSGATLTVNSTKLGQVALHIPASAKITLKEANQADGFDNTYVIPGVGSARFVLASDAFQFLQLTDHNQSIQCEQDF
jgi:hypothetical protein